MVYITKLTDSSLVINSIGCRALCYPMLLLCSTIFIDCVSIQKEVHVIALSWHGLPTDFLLTFQPALLFSKWLISFTLYCICHTCSHGFLPHRWLCSFLSDGPKPTQLSMHRSTAVPLVRSSLTPPVKSHPVCSCLNL